MQVEYCCGSLCIESINLLMTSELILVIVFIHVLCFRKLVLAVVFGFIFVCVLSGYCM